MKRSSTFAVLVLSLALCWVPLAFAQHVSPSAGSVGGKVVKPGAASIGGAKPKTPGAASIGGSTVARPPIPHPPAIVAAHPSSPTVAPTGQLPKKK